MGFVEDFGGSKEELERTRLERARIAREGAEETARIYQEERDEERLHGEYRDWQRRHNRWDVSYVDWRAGRYVHLVIDAD